MTIRAVMKRFISGFGKSLVALVAQSVRIIVSPIKATLATSEAKTSLTDGSSTSGTGLSSFGLDRFMLVASGVKIYRVDGGRVSQIDTA